jgi:hypothetical protein
MKAEQAAALLARTPPFAALDVLTRSCACLSAEVIWIGHQG